MFKVQPALSEDRLYLENAARLLVTHTALADLSLPDAREVVGFMRPLHVPLGTVFMEEGEPHQTDFLLLVLEGEVSVRSQMDGLPNSIEMAHLGPGNLIGEMGVLDGAPRTATCTAVTDLVAATLSRTALLRMITINPPVGSRLMLAIAVSLSQRLRAANHKIKALTGVSRALEQELDAAHQAISPAVAQMAPMRMHLREREQEPDADEWGDSGIRLHAFADTQRLPATTR